MFVKVKDDWYNVSQIVRIFACGKPKDRWYRLELANGIFIDPDNAEWLRIKKLLPSERITKAKASK